MSFMFEVFYTAPVDTSREQELSSLMAPFGGKLTWRDLPAHPACLAISLYFEFDDRRNAEKAAKLLYEQGVHVEGICDYGD
jgi:hypothetical protein